MSEVEMPRERTGYVFRDKSGKWNVRITYLDRSGKKHNIVRVVKDQVDGRRKLKELGREIEARLAVEPGKVDARTMTVEWLCDHYLEHFCKPAVYVGGRKAEGLRNWQRVATYVKNIRAHFGRRLVHSLTLGDLKRYRQARLQTPTQHGGQRTLTAVNREMEYLRRLLNIAAEEGWIQRTPFAPGLVSKADERCRERVVSPEEEARLLAACVGVKRRHLRPLVLLALDTGMRRGEALKLVWSDVDFAAGLIHVRAWNTKTMRARTVPLTRRVAAQLRALREEAGAKSSDLVFGGLTQFDKGWHRVVEEAGLEGVRFHDLRHTAATRLVQGGMPIAEVARILGHTTLQMTFRYVNGDAATLTRAAEIFNSLAGTAHPVTLRETILGNEKSDKTDGPLPPEPSKSEQPGGLA
jgi:integrase